MRTVKGHLGSVTFDGETVVIEKKLRGATRIPVDNIQSISVEKAGIGMRGVRFAVAGGSQAHNQVALGAHKDLAQDPYGLTFRTKALPEFEALVSEVEAARR